MHKFIRTITILVVICGIFWRCNSGQEAVQKAENEVFAVHDEIMPVVMGDLVKLQKQLKQRILSLDSLKASGSAAATLRTDEEKEQAARLSKDLTIADSLMNDWMAQYNSDTLTKLSSDEALTYLAAQKDQITNVKKRVNSSVEHSRQFLAKQ